MRRIFLDLVSLMPSPTLALSIADSASPPAAGIDVYIVIGERMSALAMCLGGQEVPPLLERIALVVFVSTSEKVLRIAAVTDIACMANNHSSRDFALYEDEH